MVSMLLRYLIVAAVVYLMALVLPGMRLRRFRTALVVAGVYGLLNFVLFKVLIFITFPLVVLKYLTLGVFGLVMNAVLLVVTDKLLDDFELSGFGTALLAALGISATNVALTLFGL
ncbi:MAG: phage holin family protein [Deltaproteobacteria bacterium]|nr:phage holin family protein [Deltaproteobacteria bacterium]